MTILLNKYVWHTVYKIALVLNILFYVGNTDIIWFTFWLFIVQYAVLLLSIIITKYVGKFVYKLCTTDFFVDLRHPAFSRKLKR